MTETGRTLCDCPEPCGCYAEGYAAGKDKAYFDILSRSSPALFELVEWALEDPPE